MTAKTGLFAVTAAAAIVTFAAGWAIPRAKPGFPAQRCRLRRSK